MYLFQSAEEGHLRSLYCVGHLCVGTLEAVREEEPEQTEALSLRLSSLDAVKDL